MNIRQATLEDVGKLIELGMGVTEESPRYRNYTPDYKRQYSIATMMILNPAACVLVFEDFSGFLTGHLEQLAWFQEYLAVEDILYVKPEFQKSSRAVRLVKAFEDWAAEQPYDVVETRIGTTTEIEPAKTISFYEGLGYNCLGAYLYKELKS